MYSLIEYSDGYLKKFRVLWQYCKYGLAVDAISEILDSTAANSINDSFKNFLKI